jgi:hypothetical protein
MTIRSILAAGAAAAALAAASSASALTMVTFNLGGTPNATAQTFTYPGSPAGELSLTISGYTYGFAPNGIGGAGHILPTSGSNSDFTLTNIFRDATGVGVCFEASTAPDCPTVDTTPNGNNGNETLGVVFSESATLQSITVSGFTSTANFVLWRADPTTGVLSSVHTVNPLGATNPLTINLASLGFTSSTFALTNVGNNDAGYHVNQIVVGVQDVVIPPVPVPEPATWTMMIVGFGGVGALIRRRRPAPALVRVTA